MQDYLNEEEEDESPYNSDEKISDEVNDFEDDDTSDDDFDSDSTEEFEETTVRETPEETETQRDVVEEPTGDSHSSTEEFPEVDPPQEEAPQNQSQETTPGPESPSFRVMSFEDFVSAK